VNSRGDEFDRKAEELERVAARLPLGSQRDEYLILAQHWRELADAARRSERRGL
jgi:hypothetical protein